MQQQNHHVEVGGCALKKHCPLSQPLRGIAFAMPRILFGSWGALKSNTPPLLHDHYLSYRTLGTNVWLTINTFWSH